MLNENVDHGKTTFLDRIRQTSITAKEPGQITQCIGASIVPKNVIETICGQLLKKFRFRVDVPGLLFIDTPGHEAFTSLRRRGGALADMAVLIVDIMEGVMPQTEESLKILKEEKTPFVVAINKIDRIRGWRTHGALQGSAQSGPVSYEEQPEHARQEFEEKFYRVLGQISSFGFSCDRFDRIQDFRNTVAVVPMSGKSGDGIPEVLAMLVGLSQAFLKDSLRLTEEGRGFILEVKETTGLGKTADVILYDGKLKKGGWIAVGGSQPYVTKIKALLMPKPLREIHAETQFLNVEESRAACGVKISAPGMEKATAGAKIIAGKDRKSAELALKQLEKERESIEVRRDADGLVLKTDTIGSLEALLKIMKGYTIRKATIGAITKEDIADAEANSSEKNRVIIAFNAPPSKEISELAKKCRVEIIETDVIYRIIDEYSRFVKNLEERTMQKEIADVTRPAQVTVMKGYVFRQSNPAIAGCEVRGLLRPKAGLMKEGRGAVGKVRQIQKEGENVEEAKSGDRVAVSIEGATIGRQILEGDVLYTDISSEERRILAKFSDILSKDENEILEKITEIKRREDKRYGM